MRNSTNKKLVAVLVVACLGWVVACAEDGAAPPDSVPQEPSTIPDGTYERVATRADGEALGLPPDLIDAMLGSDGEAPVAFTFAGDEWTNLGTNDAGIEEIGDLGTSRYDDRGRWVATSEGSGCSGCVATIEWSYADGSLTLKMLSNPDSPTPDADRLIVDGTYRLRAPDDEEAAATNVTTLTLASAQEDLLPEIVAYMVELQHASSGAVALDFNPNYVMESGWNSVSEANLIDDIASGKLDMGWVGAGALPEFGALVAPMLVDSFELEDAVFDAGVPIRMLGDLGDERLVGIAVLPGPMRKIMAVDTRLLTTSDFVGKVVAADGSADATATLRALGATRAITHGGMALDGIDGLETSLIGISSFMYQNEANSVTADLNLWPRPLVLIVNRDVFESLTVTQQAALRTAAASAIGPAAREARGEDAVAASYLCDSPMDVLETSDENLRQIEAALVPVYSDLNRGPRTAAYINEIRALKDELDAPPATLVCD